MAAKPIDSAGHVQVDNTALPARRSVRSQPRPRTTDGSRAAGALDVREAPRPVGVLQARYLASAPDPASGPIDPPAGQTDPEYVSKLLCPRPTVALPKRPGMPCVSREFMQR